jgi:signal transduction histidine kinase
MSSPRDAATGILSRPDHGQRRLLRQRLLPHSLRTRFTIASAVTLTIVLAIMWVLLGAMFEDHIERLTENELQSRLLELAEGLSLDAENHPVFTAEPTDPRYQRPAGGAYWRISEHGQTILRSLSLWDSDITPSRSLHFSPSGLARESRGPNGSTVYLAEREVTIEGTNGPHRLNLGVALDTAAVEKLQRSFERQVVIALVVIGVAVSIGAWIQSSYGLRPLKRIQAQLARLRSGDATRMTGEYPNEVAPLVEDLNKLLERQDELVRRARERAGDLAHGLKTPLTVLQIEAQNAKARGETAAAASIQEQVDQMKGHVERELSRARLSGAWSGGAGKVEARRAVERLVRIMRSMPRGDSIQWRNELPDDLRIAMDPDDFGEVVGNLLDNARKHADRLVRIGAEGRGRDQVLCFDDDGAGVSREQQENIRRRGERASGAGEGSGLGLAIVIESLKPYGLQLIIAESPLGGCRMAFPVIGSAESER